MISKVKDVTKDNVDAFLMTSEDGKETPQAYIEYSYKNVKKGKVANAVFKGDIVSDYDCAYSMLVNTIPEGIYRCVINNKNDEPIYPLIIEAAKRAGFVEFRGKFVKDF